MRIAALIARLLLGLIFFVFGLNGFLHFLSMGPMPAGLAGQYITVMMQSHYLYFVAAFQVAGGALLLIGRYIPLALTLLGPVIVNILLYHLLYEPKGDAHGDYRHDSVGYCVLSQPAILFRPLYAKNGIVRRG